MRFYCSNNEISNDWVQCSGIDYIGQSKRRLFCPQTVGVQFVSECRVRLGQANDPFDMDSLGGNLLVLENLHLSSYIRRCE